MGAPLDIVDAIHNALRRDMLEIDQAAYRIAKHGGDLSPVLDRLRTLDKVLRNHAMSENEAVFPAVDKVAPLVAKAYFLDHDELDTMTEDLDRVMGAQDELEAARATAALWAHLRIHLAKEDVHLYPILKERLSPAEQAPIVEHFAVNCGRSEVEWAVPLLDNEDRALLLRTWMEYIPEKRFDRMKPAIRDALLAKDWDELTRRVPKLA